VLGLHMTSYPINLANRSTSLLNGQYRANAVK
jgi:hypothetical protein